MKKLFQINVANNLGSTGKIAESISCVAKENAWQTYTAYGRASKGVSVSTEIRIGNKYSPIFNAIKARFLDNDGFSAAANTRKLVKYMESVSPDIVQIHNLHGYFINIEILFNYLKQKNIPTFWTLHDCWSFTGHCGQFNLVDCHKWKTQCFKCPLTHTYPSSYFLDNSRKNYTKKKNLYADFENLHLIPVSYWLENLLKKSFLSKRKISTIHNGIDLSVFRPKNDETVLKKYNIKGKFIILGVANIWTKEKGFDDFLKLSKKLPSDWQIVLVGVNDKNLKILPKNITGIKRTSDMAELASLYSAADVFANPSYLDTLSTVNLEANACGLPVVSYETAGNPECLSKDTGIVVSVGNLDEMEKGIRIVFEKGKKSFSENCRKWSEENFDNNKAFSKYLKLYDSALETGA